MYTKGEIFDLALSNLLLTVRVSNVEVDAQKEIQVLRTLWKPSLVTALADMDLDATAIFHTPMSLVVEHPTPDWHYAYQYPLNCALFRRVRHKMLHHHHERRIHRDVRSTQIPREISNYNNQKVVFTNEHHAYCEYIPFDLSLNLLSGPAGICIGYKLAEMAAPLIAGKGAGPLRKEIRELYSMYKAQAQALDRQENATFETDVEMSEFVQTRLS